MDALAAADPLAPSEARVTPVVGATRRRGHRAQSDVWRHLTAEPSPHQRTSSRCMHCQQRIPHHRKSEKARAHLNRCAPFRRQMTQLAPTARPSWVDLAVRPRGRVVESDRDPDPLPIVPAPPAVVAAVQPEPTLPTATEHPPTNDSVQMALASHCYITGVPLTTMTGPHLAAAFAASGSTITVELPTAEDLTGSLLQRTLATVHERIDVQMASRSFTALACNSWWRRDGGDDDDDVELRVHYSVVTEGRVLLLETARPSVVQWQDASHKMAELERVIKRCHRNVCGAVMDNAADSQLVWRQLKTRYPGKFFHGCVSHGLRLLIEDVFGSGRSPEPPAVSSVATPDHVNASGDSHPFSELRQLVENCRVVAMLLQQDEQTSAELTRRLELEGGDSRILQFPRKNDWYRLRSGLNSFLGALGVLGRILAEPSFVTEAPIYLQGQRVFVTNTVLHPEFMASLQKAIAILDPINRLLAHFEDAAVPCSEVFASFAKTLPDALSKVVGLTDRERSHLLLLNQSRFNLMYGDGHGIAYLLDPRYVGEGLSVEIRKNIEDLVFDFPLDSPGNGGGSTGAGEGNSEEHKFDVAQQLTEYVIDASRERTNRSFRFLLLEKKKKTVLQYWLTDGQHWPLLQQLALKVFCLPSSTVRMERRIADAGALPTAVGSDSGGLVSTEVADKLLFIRANSCLLAQPETFGRQASPPSQ